MRTYIDFAGGVVSVDRTGSTSNVFVYVTPPLEILPDLSSFGSIDFELRILGLEIADLGATEQLMLYFETSLQNTEDAPEYWSKLGEVEEGIDLATVSAPMVVSTSITRGLLRYFRWCIAIPGHGSAPAVSVKAVSQLRGYGRT